MAFLVENACNIKRRLDMEFRPTTNWTQLPLDVEEEIVTCPPSMHKDHEVAPSSIALNQSKGIKVLPPPTWKRLHPKISKPSSSTALCKSVYKIPSRASREVVRYNTNIIGWCR